MEKHRLLIVDSSEDFQLALSEILQEEYHIHCCRDGKEALALLQEVHPQLMVLDLMIPGLDGLSLLQIASERGPLPLVLAVTSFYNSYTLQVLSRLKVSYVMVKPCDRAAIVSRIHDLDQTLREQATQVRDPHAIAGDILLSLGFSSKHRGYTYLQDAAILYSHNPSQSITKELYPAIAQLHNCLRCSVERSIRTAIEAAWCRGDREVWLRYFPGTPGMPASRPSNYAFLSRLYEALNQPL